MRKITSVQSQAQRFLELVAVSGEYPVSGIHLIFGEGRYREKVIAELKEEGVIRSFNKDKVRGYRITARGKRRLLESKPARFLFYLDGNVETNYKKSELPRRQRLHRMAEINAMMIKAKVDIWRDSKPALFSREQKARCPPVLSNPVYYSSREIKEIGLEAIKIKNSRSIGILITESDVFILFHTGDSIMKWQYQSELRFKAVISYLLKRLGFSQGNIIENIKAIMVGSDMSMAYQLMTSNGRYQKSCFTLDESFESMYFIPADNHGIVLLKILISKEIRDELQEILSADLIKQDGCNSVDCDAVDKQRRPVLYAFDFNMHRIARFQAAVTLRKLYAVMICFDFQKEVLEEFCNNRIEIQTIGFEKAERRFFSE